MTVLGFITREIIFAVVGTGMFLVLVILGLIFHGRLGILRRELHVRQRLSKTRVFLGDTVDGELTIRNGSRLAAQILSVQPVPEKALSLGPSSSFNQLLRPGATSSSRFTITPLARGHFQIHGFTLTLTDARGLFKGEVKYAQADCVEVYPSMRTSLTPLRLYGGSLDIFRRAPTGADYASTRQYTPSDEYSRIEWKASARLRTLMVKEFHPETQGTLQILIDIGMTMSQPSYVGAKCDEAFAIACLLTQSAMESGTEIGLWVYNEAEIVKGMKPATAREQLLNLQELSIASIAQPSSDGTARHVPPVLVSQPGTPSTLRNEHMAVFVQLLRSKLRLGYRKAGLHKAFTEAIRTSPDGFFVVLTDLQTNTDALRAVASTQSKPGRIITAQIGAAWRFSGSLEDAYLRYQRNGRTFQRLGRSGVIVLDLRPEVLLGTIAQHFVMGRT